MTRKERALKTLEQMRYGGRYKETGSLISLEVLEDFEIAIQALKEEPKTMHWTKITDKTGHFVWECDKCGYQQSNDTNFCPDCGAKKIGYVKA